MNITFLSPGLNKNRGGERVIFGYAKALSQTGHNISIVVPNGTVHLEDKNVHILQYKTIFSPFISRQIAYLDAIVPAIKKIPKNTDIIIGTYVPQMIIGNIYKLLNKNVKYIMFNQDFSDMFINRPERLLMFKIYPKFADRIISISKFCADEINKYTNIKSDIIRNGLEKEFFELAPKDDISEKYIFWLGSNNKHKGYLEFWQAMNIVWKKYPNIKIYTTSSAYFTNKNVKILSINGNIEMLKKIYRNALLFVCSSYSEGFGLPGLEAMSQKCAVITTNTGGSNEYAQNDFNSMVIPPRDSIALANAIVKLIEDPDLRLKFANNGYSTSKHFNWDIAYKKFETLIISRKAK